MRYIPIGGSLQEKRIDGVWQPFSEPVLDGSYGKIGAGAMVEYRGVFDPTKTYEGYPSKIVAVKHNGKVLQN